MRVYEERVGESLREAMTKESSFLAALFRLSITASFFGSLLLAQLACARVAVYKY